MSSLTNRLLAVAVVSGLLTTAALPAEAARRRRSTTTTVVSSPPAATSCASPATGGFKPQRNIAYTQRSGVSSNLISLDVYPGPGVCASPTLVWVHGGAWSLGDKSNALDDKVRWANALGYTLVSVNYRLSTKSAATPVVYPDHNDDVAAAVRWLEANGPKYGADPTRLALMGHSAGASIVSSVATDPTHLNKSAPGPSPIDCFISVDTEGYDIAALLAAATPGSTQDEKYRAAFGNDPAVWVLASPTTHASKSTAPSLLLTRGSADRRAQTQVFATKLRTAGATTTVVPIAGLSHLEINSVIGTAADKVVTPAISSFLTQCLLR